MFIPHSEADRQEMLKAIGFDTIEALFESIPTEYRFPHLDLPQRLSEMEVLVELGEASSGNLTCNELAVFLGAGAYNHYIPAAIPAITGRGEFLTAYTPYQPEVSQGTLQAIYEYQSMICKLTGMDVSNASHYDGATAATEAVNMSQSIFRGKRKKVILSPALHPHFLKTIHTYNQNGDIEFLGKDVDLSSGPDVLIPLIDQDTALVLVGYPDFLGRVYDYQKLADASHAQGALLGVSVNPMALGILTPPGEFGADIVVGEGQPLGIPLSYGGPYLGILATKEQFVRSIAGRLVGETTDTRGKRGFVLTLSTREQHIRRDKAASNICSNQGLMALTTAVYLSLIGKSGLQQVASLCYNKAHYTAEEIKKIKGFSLWSDQTFFNEFVVKCPMPASEINEFLLDHGVLGGLDLGNYYSGMENYMMLALTELNSREEIDDLMEMLVEVTHG